MTDHSWEEFSGLYKFIKPNKELYPNSFFDIVLFYLSVISIGNKGKNQDYF